MREFNEWMAYYSIEPFGIDREDFRMGQVCSVIANVNRDPKQKPQPYTPDNFIPMSKEQKRKQTAVKVLNTIKGLEKNGN